MVKKILVLAGIISLLFLSACATTSQVHVEKNMQWYIVQSPITERYYEVIRVFGGLDNTIGIAMSEVTEEEYNAYIQGKAE